ncbi:hypothetical protein HMPREF1624_01487 [Sporothrix schenckii ATCC 58251]|uniref:N(6)-L-threonylcarbamoyladenine synthase n=1 Tax=Sporothrix schenckii (strain ATCC 58251 / de Perez 2211183) TaxID=1391915 RepID=U7Q7J7_SPOS1|nr:hypothetical protein HMPREF1624_01487 [Sporothrix schenckii ATCC 58251]
MRTFTRISSRQPCRLYLTHHPSQISPANLVSLSGTARPVKESKALKTGRGFTTIAPASDAQAQRRWPNSLLTLAIETSCDDTCVAVLEKERTEAPFGATPRARLLFEERVTADNRAYGGIHPLAASESHMVALAPLVQKATACLPSGKPDFVSATRGPGMGSSLASGLSVAKGLAVAWQVPLVGVHHMQAHALAPRLVEALDAAKTAAAAASTSSAATPTTPTTPTTPPLVSFPYLSFLVSGGHTMLVHSRALNDHRILASAANIAVGDLLDKCARAILPRGFIAAAEASAGRSLPYGAILEAFAFEGQDTETYSGYRYPRQRCDEMAPFESGHGWRLEAPLSSGVLRHALRFDFSGLNGAVIKAAGGDPHMVPGGPGRVPKVPKSTGPSAGPKIPLPESERRLLARGTMQLAFEHLASRLLLALKTGAGGGGGEGRDAPPTCLVVSGGVASNQFLRYILRSALEVHRYGHLPVVAPPPSLCTDNAAMIAWAGMEMYEAGWQSDLTMLPIRKWSMDADAEDGGILGPDGWVQKRVQ